MRPLARRADLRRQVELLKHRALSRVRGIATPELLQSKGLQVGEGVSFAGLVALDPVFPWLISIGDHAILGPHCYVLAHDGTTRRTLGYTRIGRVHIGSGSFIGAGAIVLPGVTIGDGAIIGAGSVVRSSVPANVVAAGSPSIVRCTVDEYYERQRVILETVPRYGREFTLKEDVSELRRDQMRDELESATGFVK